MPKLSPRVIQDGRESERMHVGQRVEAQRQTRTRKSDLRLDENYAKPPCTQCTGRHHPPLEPLKYHPLRKQWLCRQCDPRRPSG